MLSDSCLTTAQVLDVFAEVVTGQQGHVSDVVDDGRRLWARSVLPRLEEVRPGDRLQGGVALKVSDDQVCAFPYVFRQVCQNGAIVAQTLDARSVADLREIEPEEAVETIREGILACSAPEVFSDNVRAMRASCNVEANLAISFFAMFSRFAPHRDPQLVSAIMSQFFREGDRSRFGLANAVTAVARETRDPELKWNLEELGGAIAVGRTPTPPPLESRRAVVRPSELVSVD